MLAHLPIPPTSPSTIELSLSIVKSITLLLAKETHEGAVRVLTERTLPRHLIGLLKENVYIPAETTGLIVKEMGTSKPSIRRLFCGLAGNVFLATGEVNFGSGAAFEFSTALLPALEENLKIVAENPLGIGAGPLEGYVAVVILLGVFSPTGMFDHVMAKNAILSSLVAPSLTKPSFLLWDRVYQKLSESSEERWLLRSCEVVLKHFKSDFQKIDLLRTQLGLVFVHLSLEGTSPEIRKDVNTLVREAAVAMPEIINLVIKQGVLAFLAPTGTYSSKAAAEGEQKKEWVKHKRLSSLFFSAVSFRRGNIEVGIREKLLAELVVLAHHPLVCGISRQMWIELCQRAETDPQELTTQHVGRLIELLLEASMSESSAFAEASYRAVSTLVFVSPKVVLPRIMERLKFDLDPSVVGSLSEYDLGVLATPVGTAYVDVSARDKNKSDATKDRDSGFARDVDLRKSVGNKKKVDSKKEAQALLNAQLKEEDAVRKRVLAVKANLLRGLHLVKSLVMSGVDEFKDVISLITKWLLDGVLTANQATSLVGEAAMSAYLEMSTRISERLGGTRRWIGVATLRSFNVSVVPQELKVELLNSLILRVLYRVRFLSEQTPFDAATFNYVYPLLSHIFLAGGIAAPGNEEALEQITLALEIVKFHCGEFSNPNFPRVSAIDNLLHIIRHQPKLSKRASSTLIDLGEAIQSSAAPEEITALLKGVLSQEFYARNCCLQTLQPFDLTDLDWSVELLIGCHDEDEQNARLARHLWEDNGLDIPESFLGILLEYLDHDNTFVRSSTPATIVEGVEHWHEGIKSTIFALQDLYRAKAKILEPEFNEYGIVVAQSIDRSDPWHTRLAIAQTFEQLAPLFSRTEVEPFFKFLIQDQALGDRATEVRRGMLAAGTSVIDLQGSTHLSNLLSIFEDHLRQPDPSNEVGDQIKEAVVILFGRVARYLDASDSRLPSIVDRLLDALKTPAEQVQMAVSDCLAPLAKPIGPRLPQLVDSLFEDLTNSQKYGTRRGAAYGLAGILKGLGIGGMKHFDVISRLKTAAEDKKRYEPRQGVMLTFETLSMTLGRLFEPYVTYVLPLLLTSFGDGVADVREATQDAARVIMGNLSGYGVKLILPSLLEGLDEKQWRTKKGSIELLGMMAYCSPRQLSLSLPVVIPRLTGVLTDSHAQVRAAANKSLKQFGEVIGNPEIQSLVPILLKALADPSKTSSALSSLLKTSFVHYIDRSSLALVVPILERGLRERGADTKKKAVQIVGNLASLTDSKDFVPYLSELLPLVHTVLVDPVPEARATAAKALGTLVERLGEAHFPDLVPGLLRTLKTDTSGVDRQGAAQGLSEVLSALGMERLEGLLPDIFVNAQSPRATIREGFMSLLVYLPATFGTRFQPHLPKIISPILSGLSDAEEYVREAAMRAGRMIITNYSTRAIELLLPELERGMFDSGWRIRQASVTLVGELLFKVSGIAGKTSDLDEEETLAEAAVAEASKRALVEVLGEEHRNRVLSALYLVRQDGVAMVRQASTQIWKALVHNTPRTVRELLPELFDQIIYLISGDEIEQQEIATRTTTEVCRKFGEKILAEIIPAIKHKASSPDARTRQGLCLVLSDIMESVSESQRENHEDDIVSMIRTSLVDDESNVRTAAAKAFDVLQEYLGAKAIDQTIPTLLEALRQPGRASGTAVHALKEVMSVRASTVFPVLIPTLTTIPMTIFNCHALSSLVTVAGHSLSKRLHVILGSLVKTLEEDPDEDLKLALEETLHAIFKSIEDAEGLNTLMMLLMGWAKNRAPKRRVSACSLLAIFCEQSEQDWSSYRGDWISQLVVMLEDRQVEVYTAAWNALDIFVKYIPKDELESLVIPLRRSIELTGGPGLIVPGFNIQKGVSPTVPIIIAGLTTGTHEQKEHAAYAIGELVERTDEFAIKPFVVPFTGPLIRVVTQATTCPPAVKSAILSALTTMLERIPTLIKPFFPQLQRTFVKSSSDPTSSTVRSKAAEALGVLMKNQPRVDPVITELLTGIKGNDDAVSTSLVNALSNVIKNSSHNVGEKAREACADLIAESFRSDRGDKYLEAIQLLKSTFSSDAEPT